ncbi:MAG: sialate O-acetylesterase [Akkermansiaceae bacterium]
MKRFVTILLFVASFARGEHFRLFVLTGQSNSLGTTAGGEVDPTAGNDPGDSGVKVWWHNIANALTSLGDSGSEWVELQDQQGGFYPGSATHWGPEVAFARTLFRAGVRQFGVIKASRGGGGNTNWSKSSGGHMYAHLLATVDAATTALISQGHTFEIVGLMYLQGESDTAAEAAIADVRLSELIVNLRADLPNAASMKAVIGGVAAAGGNRNTVRAKQAGLAQEEASISYFENLDLQDRLYDNLHFDKEAKKEIGRRYAKEFYELGVVSPDYGDLTFVGDSITQGGLGFASYRYEVFKHLVDAGAAYEFVGSVNGAYQGNACHTPEYEGVVFENFHEGHWGWRAFWSNGRVPLPASRRGGNRGEGTVANWIGQSNQYAVNTAGNFVPYPDPAAVGSGNTGTTYLPDSVVIMMGINDLAGGSSEAQLRDDLAAMIDQWRAANPEVRIFLNRLLLTNQGAAFQERVDRFNDLLQPLADLKNTVSPGSPVWVIDPSTGFDPVSMTHDAVHPNGVGEEHVGRRIAEGMGMFPVDAVEVPEIFAVTERESLQVNFAGNEIFDGSSYINGWSEVTASATSESLSGNILTRTHLNGAGAWLEGITSSRDGGTTTWNSGNDGDWTFEIRMRFQANPAGYTIWLGTGTNRIIVDVFGNRTQDSGGQSFNVAHDNLDGAFHTWRIAHDASEGRYHVWRDAVRLTPVAGVSYDSAGSDSRVVLGDRTGGAFGNLYQVEIASISYDQTGGYLPPGADFDDDGMPDAFEYEFFQSIEGGDPNDDLDGDGVTNLEEYGADTDPTNALSFFSIESLEETKGGIRVYLNQASPKRVYRLYRSDDLGVSDSWGLIDGPEAGTGGAMILRDLEVRGVSTFYRVGVEIP